MNQKNILIITNKVVFPAFDGGAMAMKNFTDILMEIGCQIDIICIAKQQDVLIKENVIEQQIKKQIHQTIFYKKMRFNFFEFCKSIYTQKAYQSIRFYNENIKESIQKKILKKNYDYIIFESIFSTIYLNYLNIDNNTKIIYRAHNIEHKIWEDLAKNIFLKKIPYLLLAHQIKKIETKISQYVDYIFTLAIDDYTYYSNSVPNKTHYIPVTFETQKNNKQKIENSIVHLGAMDWKPNHEGMKWFMKMVLPKIRKHKINTKVYIAGKGMPPYYEKFKDKLTFIEGKVENAKEFIENKEVLFVPLFSGSGIRIKILEGMSLGIPVISTLKGAKGIPYVDKEDIIIANTPIEFAKAVNSLMNDKKLAKKIGHKGQNLIEKNFSKKSIMNKVKKIFNEKS